MTYLLLLLLIIHIFLSYRGSRIALRSGSLNIIQKLSFVILLWLLPFAWYLIMLAYLKRLVEGDTDTKGKVISINERDQSSPDQMSGS